MSEMQTHHQRMQDRRATVTPRSPYQGAMRAGFYADGYADRVNGYAPQPPIAPGFAMAYMRGYEDAA